MIELRDESGFTLVEVLVVIGLMLMVLGATLTTFTQFEVTQRVNQLQNCLLYTSPSPRDS